MILRAGVSIQNIIHLKYKNFILKFIKKKIYIFLENIRLVYFEISYT